MDAGPERENAADRPEPRAQQHQRKRDHELFALQRLAALLDQDRVEPFADALEAHFDEPQRSPTPGQFIVLYDGERCLGGATIDAALPASIAVRAAG